MRRGPYMRYHVDLDREMPNSTQRDHERRLQLQEAPALGNAENVEDDDRNSNRSRSSLGSEHSEPHDNEPDGSGNSNSSAAESEDNSDRESVNHHSESASDDNDSDRNSENDEGEHDNNSENDEGEHDNNSEEGSENSDEDGANDVRENFVAPAHGEEDPHRHPQEPDDPDEDPEEEGPREPIYPGCPITKDEGTLLIMTFALRFGLSDLAIEHLLAVIECHMPVENVYGSFHCFKQEIPAPPIVQRQYYCPQPRCKRLVTFVDEEDNVNCECAYECNRNTLDKGQSYFLSLPLTVQLIHLFEDRKVFDSLRWEDRSQSDVVNGQFYKMCIDRGIVRAGRDLTLQFNTDGVQVFKSSKLQMWPIQVSINELPYKPRKDNIILCGLWFGGKPNMNTFLSPFIDELTTLHRDGFVVPGDEPQVFRVHTILSSVDSMARPSMQGLKTHRGYFGCSFCLHPGEERFVGDRGGRSHLYPGDKQQARTQAQHIRDTAIYFERRRARLFQVNGIHGAAELLRLPVFNIIESFVPDYLHAVLLGVVKTMVCEYWTQSSRPPKPYYLSPAKIADFDIALLTIKPPSEITRTPRPLDNKKLWRGHEWKNFLLYYSLPCLIKVNFPARFVNHWFLLVYSMSIFLSDHIDQENLELGTAALRKYVLTLEDVYEHEEIMKFNTHLLLHIPKSVRDFGGLWAWSTFCYEHYNGMLAKMFQSSQAAHLQICKNYVRLQGLKSKSGGLADNVGIPLCLRKALKDIGAGRSSRHAFRANRNLTLIGVPDSGELTCLQLNLIQNLLNVNVKNVGVMFYNRFIYKHALHHVEGYQQLKKRLNSVVKLIGNEFISITHAVKVETDEINPRRFCIILGCRLRPTGDHLCVDRDLGINSDNFVTVVERTQECVAIPPQRIERKCVFTFHPRDDDTFCCFPLPNVLERD